MQPKLYEWGDKSLLFYNGRPQPHHSMGITPTLLMGSQPFVIEFLGERYCSNTFLLEPNKPFTVSSEAPRMALLPLNPAAEDHVFLLRNYAWDLCVEGVFYKQDGDLLQQTLFYLDESDIPHPIATWCLFNAIYGEESLITLKKYDKRIAKAVAHIIRNPTSDLSVDAIAAQVHLSPTRFMTLFSALNGLSYNKYKIVSRLQYFFERYSIAHNLTHAAAEAGFYDLSHLNKSVKMYYGMSPREFLAVGQDLITISSPSHNRAWYADWVQYGYFELTQAYSEISVPELLAHLRDYVRAE
ncbi:AraC family transcriptional regulator [Hahella sp. CR1]|uniref:AraC family transcriptional regulator n=1 Tax=Hahella sp. CR1 TaxID=2992807 RepID=UPI00244117DC|nr:AraC family transcriptional regulator [Hahella sp. CR1]MDG9669263.1 AraC family transcriptional regulator [Hahella sp. CR1]